MQRKDDEEEKRKSDAKRVAEEAAAAAAQSKVSVSDNVLDKIRQADAERELNKRESGGNGTAQDGKEGKDDGLTASAQIVRPSCPTVL